MKRMTSGSSNFITQLGERSLRVKKQKNYYTFLSLSFVVLILFSATLVYGQGEEIYIPLTEKQGKEIVIKDPTELRQKTDSAPVEPEKSVKDARKIKTEKSGIDKPKTDKVVSKVENQQTEHSVGSSEKSQTKSEAVKPDVSKLENDKSSNANVKSEMVKTESIDSKKVTEETVLNPANTTASNSAMIESKQDDDKEIEDTTSALVADEVKEEANKIVKYNSEYPIKKVGNGYIWFAVVFLALLIVVFAFT